MKNLRIGLQKLSHRQKLAAAALLALILLTWLAVCVVLLLPAS